MRKLLFLIVFSAILLAQPHQGPPPMEPEMKEQIQNIRKWKLLEELELTSEQSDKFLPLLTEYQNQMDEIESRHREITEELKGEVFDRDGNKLQVSEELEKKLEAKCNEIAELQREKCNLEVDFNESVAEILDPVQLYTYITFDSRFHMEMRKLLRQFWHKREGGGMPMMERK